MKKHYISAESLLQDSITLALEIAKSNWQPDLIVGIWRGGTPVGIAVQEVLEFIGIRADHFSIRTSSYSCIGKRSEVKVHGLEYLQHQLRPDVKLLLVDDVYDTGLSMNQVLSDLENSAKDTKIEIRIATPYFKPANNQTSREPDYYLHITSNWLVFPHELTGLTDQEILLGKPGLEALSEQLFSMRDQLLADTINDILPKQ